MPLSKRLSGQRPLGFCCFFVYIQNLGAALMWGSLVPCLFSLKKIRKDERWRDGRRRNRREREENLEERGGSVFSSDTGVIFIGINTRSLYQCKEYLGRPEFMAYSEFLFWLCLFLIKHFTCSSKSNSPRRAVTGIEQAEN